MAPLPHLPEPVEIAAGAWQLLPITAEDRAEVEALDQPAGVIATVLTELDDALDGASCAWTIRTAVGGWITGVVAAVPTRADDSAHTLAVHTAMTTSADPSAASTARHAVVRYVEAVGFTVVAP